MEPGVGVRPSPSCGRLSGVTPPAPHPPMLIRLCGCAGSGLSRVCSCGEGRYCSLLGGPLGDGMSCTSGRLGWGGGRSLEPETPRRRRRRPTGQQDLASKPGLYQHKQQAHTCRPLSKLPPSSYGRACAVAAMAAGRWGVAAAGGHRVA